MIVELVYDGSINPAQISQSRNFKNAQFLIFDTPDRPKNEGVEIGFVLVVTIPFLLHSIEKDVSLPSFEFQGTLSSFSCIEVPREYSESGYNLKCAFNSSIAISSFKVYAVTSNVTQESLSKQVKELKELTDNLSDKVDSIKSTVEEIKLQLEALQQQEQLDDVTQELILKLIQHLPALILAG